MPMIVRTPEDIFRAEKKDFYAIHNLEGDDSPDSSGIVMIAQWIKDNLPATKTELLGPSESSGWISGGMDGSFRVDFAPEGLERFCDRWEANGESVDPRFQCFIHPYQKWFEEHGQYVPSTERPQEAGLTIWVHTPKGFLYHQIGLAQAQALQILAHPANHKDIWMHVSDIWPDMADLGFYGMATGSTQLGTSGQIERMFYTLPVWERIQGYQPPALEEIRAWFSIPDGVELVEDSF